jgi:hypothetical protein
VIRALLLLVLILVACSPKLQQPVEIKPSWLLGKPASSDYYVGIGYGSKTTDSNYIQVAKKSALEDLVSEIKVTVSSSSVLSTFEDNKGLREAYEQIIQTTAADEIEEFEMVGSWEDGTGYWVYYRLSKERYRQIKEQQKRNAVLLATDYYEKAMDAESAGDRLRAIGFYFQAFRSMEKYLGEAITVTVKGKTIFITNEIYASIQNLLSKIQLRTEPGVVTLNRRLNQNGEAVLIKSTFSDLSKPAASLPIIAEFVKGGGEVFPVYKTDEAGSAKMLINKITSRELEQSISIKINLDELSGTSSSPVYALISKRLQGPSSLIVLNVKRPIVFITASEKSFGFNKPNDQISNRLKNLLTQSGFEFTNQPNNADLQIDVLADAEKGSISGSIFITYLTGTIKVKALKEGSEVYSTVFDRIKGYGLDYDKSSQDAYNKALEILEKERLQELLNTVLQ